MIEPKCKIHPEEKVEVTICPTCDGNMFINLNPVYPPKPIPCTNPKCDWGDEIECGACNYCESFVR